MFVLSLIASPACGQQVLFVNGSLTIGDANGSSWANAYRGPAALQNALDRAALLVLSGAGHVQIWVAQGDYEPPTIIYSADDVDYDLGTFYIPSETSVLGGFVGLETSAEQRDPSQHLTRLNGFARHGRIVSIEPFGQFQAIDNVELDGFTIIGSGSVYVGATADSTLDGMGIRIRNASPSIRRCIIEDHRPIRFPGADLYGGGVRIEGYPGLPVIFEDCSFANNYLSWGEGAGVGVRSGSVVFRRCSFQGNYGGYDLGGGGLYSFGATTIIEDCYFNSNRAGVWGAVVGATSILRSRFTNNTTLFGGSFVSAGELIDCVIDRNFETGTLNDSSVSAAMIDGCLFYGNTLSGTRGPMTTCQDLRNSIFLFNRNSGTINTVEQQQVVGLSSTAVPRYCAIEGWTGVLGNWPGNRAVETAWSLFQDPDGPDNLPGNMDDDFTTLPSPEITDAGDSTLVPSGVGFDFRGAPRFADDVRIPDSGVQDAASGFVVDIGPFETTSSMIRFIGSTGSLSTSSNWLGSPATAQDAALFDRNPSLPSDANISFSNGFQTSSARFQGGNWSFNADSTTSPRSWILSGSEGLVIGPDATRPTKVWFNGSAVIAPRIKVDAGGYLVAGNWNGREGVLQGVVSNLGTLELPAADSTFSNFGSLVIRGSYDQDVVQGGRRQPGVLNVSVGMRDGVFTGDSIVVDGTARIAGKLELSMLNGSGQPLPPAGSTWQLLRATGGIVLGADGRGFELIQVPFLDDGRFLLPRYDRDSNGTVVGISVVVTDLQSLLGFGGTGSQSINASDPRAVVVGDFDGRDGDDVAVALSNGTTLPGFACIFYSRHRDGQNWTGFFQPVSPASIVPVGFDPVDMDRGDFDGLGFDDLVIANHGSQNVSILLSRINGATGTGFFESAAGSPVGLTQPPVTICAADFVHLPGDPIRDDFVVGVERSTQSPPALFLYRNRNTPGADTVRFPLADSKVELDEEPTSTTPTDGDGDKPIDVAVAFAARSQVRVMTNGARTNYDLGPFSVGLPIPVGNGALQIIGRTRRTPQGALWSGRIAALDTFLDVNQDGRADLITVDELSNRLSLLVHADSSFPSYFSALPIEIQPVGSGEPLTPLGLTAADLDSDGDADFGIIARDSSSQARVFHVRNDFAGNGLVLAGAVEVPGIDGTPLFLTSGDVDLDNRNDLVAVTAGTGLQGITSVVARRSDSRRCRADLDDDGVFANGSRPDGAVGIDDLLYFLTAFEAGSLSADLTDLSGPQGSQLPDQAVTLDDLLFFLERFEVGC